MKFQTIFILYSVVFIDFLYGKEGPLDSFENALRRVSCGQSSIATLKTEAVKYARGFNSISTATLISPRHVITSADIVLIFNTNVPSWFYDRSIFDSKKCENSKNNVWIQVPKGALALLKFNWTSKYCNGSQCKDTNVKAREAYVVCRATMMKDIKTLSLPMVVEIDSSIEATVPCLPIDSTYLWEKKVLDLLKYNREKDVVENRKIKFQNRVNEYFFADKYEKMEEQGGALLSREDRFVLVGIGASGKTYYSTFWDVRTFSADICDKFGICEQTQAPPTTQPIVIQPPVIPPPEPVITYSGGKGSLSTQENNERLKNCGQKDLRIFGYGTRNGMQTTTATLISSRHVLMSADILLKDGVLWNDNNEQFDGGLCTTSGSHSRIIVPDSLLPTVTFGYSSVTTTVKAVKAYIICDAYTFTKAKDLSFPMIVEVVPSVELSPPCLQTDESVDRSHNMTVFKNHEAGTMVGSWNVTITSVARAYITTKRFQIENQRGPALMRMHDWTLVGIGGGGASDFYTWFFAVKWLRDDLCDLVGICRAGELPESFQTPAPTVPSTTQEPTTVLSTPPPPPVDSTTEEPKSITPPLQPSTSTSDPAKPKPKPTKDDSWTPDSNAENEKLKEKNKGINEFDDWDNDFFEDRNFIKVATRIELFIVVLLVVMVLG